MSSFDEPLLSWFLRICYDTTLTKIPKLLGTELKRGSKRQLLSCDTCPHTDLNQGLTLWLVAGTIHHLSHLHVSHSLRKRRVGCLNISVVTARVVTTRKLQWFDTWAFFLPYFINLITCCYIKCNMKHGTSFDDFTVLEPPKSFDIENN